MSEVISKVSPNSFRYLTQAQRISPPFMRSASNTKFFSSRSDTFSRNPISSCSPRVRSFFSPFPNHYRSRLCRIFRNPFYSMFLMSSIGIHDRLSYPNHFTNAMPFFFLSTFFILYVPSFLFTADNSSS